MLNSASESSSIRLILSYDAWYKIDPFISVVEESEKGKDEDRCSPFSKDSMVDVYHALRGSFASRELSCRLCEKGRAR